MSSQWSVSSRRAVPWEAIDPPPNTEGATPPPRGGRQILSHYFTPFQAFVVRGTEERTASVTLVAGDAAEATGEA